MSIIIGFCNQKGGVGKTTTAINLAASLAIAEKKTLLIDLDPQCNATTGLGLDKKSINSSSYNILMGEPLPLPQKTELSYLDIIPSTSDLVGAEVELINVEGRESFLRRSLKGYHHEYDYIFIDSPPSLGLLTVNVLSAVSGLIIPVQCEYYALEGLTDLLRTIDRVRQGLNPSLEVYGILLTMFDRRNNLAHEVEVELRQHFPEKVFQTVIPRSVRLSEAPSFGKPVMLHDIKSTGSQSYLELAQEFLQRMSLLGADQTQKNELEGGA